MFALFVCCFSNEILVWTICPLHNMQSQLCIYDISKPSPITLSEIRDIKYSLFWMINISTCLLSVKVWDNSIMQFERRWTHQRDGQFLHNPGHKTSVTKGKEHAGLENPDGANINLWT